MTKNLVARKKSKFTRQECLECGEFSKPLTRITLLKVDTITRRGDEGIEFDVPCRLIVKTETYCWHCKAVGRHGVGALLLKDASESINQEEEKNA